MVFRVRDPQRSLLETTHLLPEEKRKRLHGTWAEEFRNRALRLMDERLFADFFCRDNGAPNKPVQIVLGTLLLKEMFNLTDMQALEQLEFNLLWQHALRLRPEEAHICQKTLHNFRARLMRSDGARLAFTSVTDKVIKALGINTARQRLDSTRITSNIALLSRLGLFCETIRSSCSRSVGATGGCSSVCRRGSVPATSKRRTGSSNRRGTRTLLPATRAAGSRSVPGTCGGFSSSSAGRAGLPWAHSSCFSGASKSSAG